MVATRYASGKHALGLCDRCGWTYKLKELRHEYVKGTRTEQLVCQTCRDPDHPQLKLGEFPIVEAEALRNPRPDSGEAASTSQFGWNPVGYNDLLGLASVRDRLSAETQLGTVTVTIT